MWRKTRKPNPNSNCVGTDANRNWDFHHAGMSTNIHIKCQRVHDNFIVILKFSEVGASRQPCAETFAGPKAFSEPETKALSEFIKKFDLKLYISFHSFSQLLLFPYVSHSFKLLRIVTNKFFKNYFRIFYHIPRATPPIMHVTTMTW